MNCTHVYENYTKFMHSMVIHIMYVCRCLPLLRLGLRQEAEKVSAVATELHRGSVACWLLRLRLMGGATSSETSELVGGRGGGAMGDLREGKEI